MCRHIYDWNIINRDVKQPIYLPTYCHSTKSDLLFSLPQPTARVSYGHSVSSVVRKLFTFSTSSPEPLDGFWWHLVGMKYSRSLTSVVVIRPDPPLQGRGKNRSRGSPSLRNFFFRPEGYSNKPNALQWSRSMWEEVLLFLVPFRSQIFDEFLTFFWTVIFAYFNAISIDFYVVNCVICIYFVSFPCL